MDEKVIENARVISLWVVVECPNCHAPRVVRRSVVHNSGAEYKKKLYDVCGICEKGFFIELE